MDELLRLLPPIKRVRGNRLYAENGARFLDLWLDGGRGILGDRDRYARTLAANAADKGLTRPYPGLYDARFAKAVRGAFPGFAAVRVFISEESALAAASAMLGAEAKLVETVRRPSAASVDGASLPGLVAIARPFSYVPPSFSVAMPRLPCPRPYSPWCLIARSEAAFSGILGDIVPAQALYASANGLERLSSAIADGYTEALWASIEKRIGLWFERSGPYLFPKVSDSGYEAFFKAALAGGALLSPRPSAPCVVPPDFDDGELVRLARSLETLATSK